MPLEWSLLETRNALRYEIAWGRALRAASCLLRRRAQDARDVARSLTRLATLSLPQAS